MQTKLETGEQVKTKNIAPEEELVVAQKEGTTSGSTNSKPNILIIMGDDTGRVGWGAHPYLNPPSRGRIIVENPIVGNLVSSSQI